MYKKSPSDTDGHWRTWISHTSAHLWSLYRHLCYVILRLWALQMNELRLEIALQGSSKSRVYLRGVWKRAAIYARPPNGSRRIKVSNTHKKAILWTTLSIACECGFIFWGDSWVILNHRGHWLLLWNLNIFVMWCGPHWHSILLSRSDWVVVTWKDCYRTSHCILNT